MPTDRRREPKPQDAEIWGRGCLTCTNLFDIIVVNGLTVNLDFRNLSCKDKDVIYIAQCLICTEKKEDTYFNHTVTPMHVRMNGNRN